MKEKISELIHSDISVYQISKETGVPQSTQSRLKKGEIEIGRITLYNALKLIEYYALHVEEIKPSN
ncbi:hypothetical protein BTS2_3832 [Bacillus sp. TS-2]|nr:hypothetical protein BTS2_3832 [Bacillus sp. TS-2]